MMTFLLSSAMPLDLIVILHQSRLVALVEAVVSGLGAILLGPAVIDPESGVRL